MKFTGIGAAQRGQLPEDGIPEMGMPSRNLEMRLKSRSENEVKGDEGRAVRKHEMWGPYRDCNLVRS